MSRGDLNEAEWRVLRGLLPIEASKRGRGRPPEENSVNHQRYTLAASLRYALARCSSQIRELEHDLPALQALDRGRGLGLGGRVSHTGRNHGR